jgi:signal transduction histidine kinase
VALILLLAPAAMTVVMCVLAIEREGSLPQLLPNETLHELLRPDAVFSTRLISPPLLLLEAVAAFVFGVAAYAYRRSWLAGRGGVYSALLALSLVVAAFSQVHFAIVPSGYVNLLTSGDFLRLAFYLIALSAVAWAIQEDLGRLRGAYADLARLRDADAERISAETRAGLAREVHDGLVQELWLARLTGGALAKVQGMPAEAKPIIERLDTTLETAMSEARQAIVTLQPKTDTRFGDLLRRFVDDYADRFDLDIRTELAIAAEPGLAPDVQSELLRICREALNNVRKHADASVVRVRLEADAGLLRLTVADNGAGFDADIAREGRGFGLASMRQRAEKIGAQISIRSALMDGTTVVVELPKVAGK